MANKFLKKTRIESLGVYFPKKKVSTKEILDQMNFKLPFDLEKVTGIKNRRFREASENSFILASKAAKKCLGKSKYKKSDLDVIINTSITQSKEKFKFMFEPPMSLFIKKHLGCHSALNFDISNACAGMFTGIYILDSMIKAGVVKNGMVVSGECISPIAENAIEEIKKPLDDQLASLTVGDSGAAIIMDESVSKNGQINYIDIMTDADHVDLCVGKSNSKGTQIAMYTKSSELSELGKKIWPPFSNEILKKNKDSLSRKNYDFIILHQISVRTINSYLKCGEKFFKTKMPETLLSVDEFGNTSSTSHFITIYKNIKNGKLKKNSKIFMVSLSSGVAIGCLSLSLSDLKI